MAEFETPGAGPRSEACPASSAGTEKNAIGSEQQQQQQRPAPGTQEPAVDGPAAKRPEAGAAETKPPAAAPAPAPTSGADGTAPPPWIQRIQPDNYRDDLHVGTAHLAVNDTWWRRMLVRLALKIGPHIYQRKTRRRERNYCCTPISPRLFVKAGPLTHLAEAATMQFVADHTSIPVPRVRCAFVRKGYAYIVMDRVRDATTLGAAMRAESKAAKTGGGGTGSSNVPALLAQLRAMVAELRALKRPPDRAARVESAAGGSLYDCRILRPETVRFGPFATIQDFHVWLREGFRPEDHLGDDHRDPEYWQKLVAMVAKQDGPWPAPVFTHGDIHAGNVLVRGDKVVALIDWECSGWLPDYWEYTASWTLALMWPEWQNEILPKIVDPCPPDVLEMEYTRQRGWGEIF